MYIYVHKIDNIDLHDVLYIIFCFINDFLRDNELRILLFGLAF